MKITNMINNSTNYFITISCRKWKPLPPQPDTHLIPFIGYGGANFGKRATFSSNRGGLSDTCKKLLKKLNDANKIIFLEIDEYLTSQVCSFCGKRSLDNVKGYWDSPLYSILSCKSCNIVMQRDVNAARNIHGILISLLTKGIRPPILSRSNPPPPHTTSPST